MLTDKLTDRELDALIAEKVMGWRRTQEIPPHEISWAKAAGEEPRQGWWLTPEWGYKLISATHDGDIPHYSTDIAAAWQVVEKMRSLGWSVLIADAIEADQKVVGYHVGFELGDGRDVVYVVDESAPQAICLAALKAME